jgi:hypothetical protein
MDGARGRREKRGTGRSAGCDGVGRVKPEVVLAAGGARCGGKVEVFARTEFGIVGLGRPTIRSSDNKTRRRYRKAHQTSSPF